jgi:uncharacterized protein YgiB involved in biofilm formation
MSPPFGFGGLPSEFRWRPKWWMVLLPGVLLLALAVEIFWGAKVEERQEQRVRIYSSLEACKAEQPAEDCAKAFAGAEDQHMKTAPRFTSRDVCEAQHGDGGCVAYHDGTGVIFIPAMVGFMLGHALAPPSSNPYPSDDPRRYTWALNQSATRSASSVVYQPVYVDRNATAYAGSSPIGSYRSRCAVNTDDPSCQGSGSGGGHGGGGFLYVSSGSGGGTSTSSGVWSSKGYAIESVTTTVSRGGFGTSASSAPTVSTRVASASAATSSSSVARGGFGATAAAHAVGS